MVTYGDLYTFVLVIVSIITLVYTIFRDKRK